MIRFTHLLHGEGTVSRLYHHQASPDSGLLAYSDRVRPVVFWNITRQCNLSCRHCYLDSGPDRAGPDELSTEEGFALIDDLAGMGVPLLIITGGEPLVRKDIWDLLPYARDRGIAIALSSNGTLITKDTAARLKQSGVEYVGISLDGASKVTHDAIRDVPGCFDSALAGISLCRAAGLKTGVRFTATKENRGDLDRLIDISRNAGVDRFCVYWLVPSGRGADWYGPGSLTPEDSEGILDTIYRAARAAGDQDPMEYLTVDAPQDAVYLLNRLKHEDPDEYARALHLLGCKGAGCSAGFRVANIDPSGTVYPCQFARSDRFRIGTIREQPFSALWKDPANPVLREFRQKTETLEGVCRGCEYRMVCGGGCRVRAWHATRNFHAGDPFCRFVADSLE